ncbi:AAA domain-containing protein [Dactylosporangium sp. CA-139066]|uniref:AAA domain-containing protein n=1 Tax=Dactylosporangium sp. CA-139066 TaxID=3239930 RepID=UPI003D8D0FDA
MEEAVDRRGALVHEASRRWRSQLIDLGGRNTLLYYRDLRAGTLDLTGADPVSLEALLGGRTLPLGQLFPDRDAHAAAIKRARTIRNKARELTEERGIETCFAAIGSATWTPPPGGGAAPAAPVLLRSAQLRARGAAEDDFDLTLQGDLELNPTLLQLLEEDFGVRVDADELEELVSYQAGFDPMPLYERLVKEAAGRVRGFAVSPRFVLGTFSYAKLPMVTDLRVAAGALVEHDVIAAIAGDRDAQAALRPAAGIALRDPDWIPPEDEFLVLDADSSQNYAINAVLAGQHSVIKGPPGTGKSQTIANLIASLVARGKRVLFVAEKRAAITAVTDRLARRGLGNLVMDVHDGTTSRRKVAADLKAAFDSAARIAQPELSVLHETLAARRAALNDHDDAMHQVREPWGISAYQAQAEMIRLSAAVFPMTAVRLRGPALAALDAAGARRVREQLRDYATVGGFAVTGEPSGWTGAAVYTPADAEAAFGLAERLGGQTLPAARPALRYVLDQTGLRAPADLNGWRSLFGFLDAVAATLAQFRDEVFSADSFWASLSSYLASVADAEWRRAHAGQPGTDAGWWTRRKMRKQAAGLWRGPGSPSRQQLFDGFSAALAQREQWARLARDGGRPRIPADLGRARAAFDQLDAQAGELQRYCPHLPLATMDLERLGRVVAALAADERTLRRVPRLNELQGAFAAAGLDPLLEDLRARRGVDADQAAAVFDACWNASILQHLNFTDPRVGAFDGPLHARTVAEYRDADRRHIDATATRVLRAVAEHITHTRDEYPDESRLVEHQANLKRRHLPIRQLFATAPHMLTALRPCWAMSPLVVSQLLPPVADLFDVVVFDEASQVTPADAVPALLRGRQVVVAGDEHQLPPTSFFTAAEEGTAADPLGVNADGSIDLSLTSGYESILDVLTALLPGYLLRWHYRSQDDRLIAFSNAHIYEGSLVTFPGVAGAGSVSHVHVPFAGAEGAEEGTDSVTAEVQRVVELILQHAQLRPNESLGVITMGITHAERIDLALRRALAARPELHAFFAETAAEPFFVKNLERVQGDERDAVILSIGYGKNSAGRLLYRFGPLLLPGGERRLNVAVTRARRRMTLVSSFTAADMDPARTTSDGVRLLRAYLEYAESAGTSLAQAAAGARPELNPFERDVRDRLAAAGIPVTPQFGVAGYTIDFACAHPTIPGEMVLAIESDGASYHSASTARDRDRLRQEQLERLGWRFHRIWSTDWFADPVAETSRARAAYDEAVAAVDARRTDEPTVVLTPPPPAEPDPAEDDGRTLARPAFEPGRPIGEYAHGLLVDLIRWIESDTLLRTEEQVLDEARRQLGFKRGGSRINAALQAALNDARGDRPQDGDEAPDPGAEPTRVLEARTDPGQRPETD